MAQKDESTHIAEVITRVAVKYPDTSTADIARVVLNLHAGYESAKIREFVPLLVEREARAILSDRQSSLTWATRPDPTRPDPIRPDVARECDLNVREPVGEQLSLHVANLVELSAQSRPWSALRTADINSSQGEHDPVPDTQLSDRPIRVTQGSKP
jgi:hypothetical protein